MQFVLDGIFSLRAWMFYQNMTAIAGITLNCQPKFSARFYPLWLRNIGKTVARHKRVASELPARCPYVKQRHYKDAAEC